MTTGRQPGTPRLLRAINDRSALELLLEHGPLTRPQLGALTGLSKPTASQLLGRLETRGLVHAVGAQEDALLAAHAVGEPGRALLDVLAGRLALGGAILSALAVVRDEIFNSTTS